MGDSSSVYATAKPLEGSVEDFTNGQKASDMMYRKMGIDRENEITKQNQKIQEETDKKNADIDRIHGKVIESNGTFTKNVEELNYNTVQKLAEKLNTVVTELKDPKTTPERKAQLYATETALRNSPQAIATAGKNLYDAYQQNQKDVKEGKAYLNEKLQAAATLSYGATAIWDDEKNQLVYAVKQKDSEGNMVEQDTNKDGKTDSLDYVTINDLIADTGKFQSEERYQLEDVAKIILPKISLNENGWNNGIRKGKDVKANKSQALELTESYYLLDNGSLTPMGKSMAIEQGKDVSTPERIERFIKDSADKFFNQKKTIHRDEQVRLTNPARLYDTESTTTQTLTDIGIAAEKRFREAKDKDGKLINEGYEMLKSDYPPGSYVTNRTTTKTLKKEKKAKTTNAGGNIR